MRLAIGYTALFYVVVYLLPLATMVVTYGRVVITLWRRRPIGDSPDTLRDSHRRLKVSSHLRLRTATRTVCLQQPRLHDTTCCQTNRLSNQLNNRFDKRLYRVYSRLVVLCKRGKSDSASLAERRISVNIVNKAHNLKEPPCLSFLPASLRCGLVL